MNNENKSNKIDRKIDELESFMEGMKSPRDNFLQIMNNEEEMYVKR